MSPTFVAFFIALFGWHDRRLPLKLVFGFEISGDLEACHIYRKIEPNISDGALARDELLGQNAIEFIDGLEDQCTPGPDAAIIEEETQKEVDHGLAGLARTGAHFDAFYGRGQWRPLPR